MMNYLCPQRGIKFSCSDVKSTCNKSAKDTFYQFFLINLCVIPEFIAKVLHEKVNQLNRNCPVTPSYTPTP